VVMLSCAGDQRDYLSGADLNKALAKSIIN
jgi:hypothetical protein